MAQDIHSSDPFPDPDGSADPSAPSASADERDPLVPVRLSIMGRAYPLRVERKDVAQFQEMGAHVNSLLRRFRSDHPTQSETTLHVLACLELAGELWSARAELQSLREDLESGAQNAAQREPGGEREFREQIEQEVLGRVNLRLEDLLEGADPDR